MNLLLRSVAMGIRHAALPLVEPIEFMRDPVRTWSGKRPFQLASITAPIVAEPACIAAHNDDPLLRAIPRPLRTVPRAGTAWQGFSDVLGTASELIGWTPLRRVSDLRRGQRSRDPRTASSCSRKARAVEGRRRRSPRPRFRTSTLS